MNKDKTDKLVDTLVHAQCFIDCLEYFETNKLEERYLFKFNLKYDVKKVIRQIRDSVNSIFNSMKDNESKQAVVKLYDINYAMHAQLNRLSLEQKVELTRQLSKH